MDNHNLPLDIISDILLRLPIKSIGRSKCVSKSWCCLISEPCFVKEHLHRSISSITDDNTRIVFNCRKENSRIKKLMLANPSQLEARDDDFYDALCKMVDSGLPSLGFDGFGGFIVGSCHGLVLILYNNDGGYLNDVIVFNPCTKYVRELPKLDTINEDAVFYGIGYDSYSDDYKVLMAEYVFSLKSNSWKRLTHIPFDYYVHETRGVYWNGSLYWIAMHKANEIAKLGSTSTGLLATERYLVSFDLATEQYLELPQLQLPTIPDTLYCQRLFVTGTYLSLFLHEGYQKEHEVWMMKEQGVESAWTKSYNVAYRYFSNYVSLVCLLKSGELLLHADGNFLVLYNPMDGSDRKFYPGDYGMYDVTDYIESLVSPYRVHDIGFGEQ